MIISAVQTAHADASYNGTKVAVVIDVRTPIEYSDGHIVGAINIPIGALGMGIQSLQGVDKNSPILVYCRSGARSARARDLLMLQGYANVIDGGSMTTLSEKMPSCKRPDCR